MTILYATGWNAQDISAWSGSVYYMAAALKKQHVELIYADKLKHEPSLMSKIRNSYHLHLIHREIQIDHESSVLKNNAQEILSKLTPHTDVVFSPSSIHFAYLKTDKLKVFYTDAVFGSMLNYNTSFSNLSAYAIRQGNKIEQRALDNCDLAIYASDWAAQSAIELYNVDPCKVKVVPLGANINISLSRADIEQLLSHRSQNVCNLLFIGVDWAGKGGDIAVQVANRLHEKGIPVHLDIVGVKQKLILPSYIQNHGFISKSTEEGAAKLNALISGAHFFILPTRTEAYGLVFAEASAFGVPSLGTKTGGVTTVIKDNVNGMTFDMSADPEEYVEYIARYFNDPEAYRQLALSAYNDSVTRLNWDVAGRRIVELIKERL
jgi:glycosyltransferase involved in cell wall biosynthesis